MPAENLRIPIQHMLNKNYRAISRKIKYQDTTGKKATAIRAVLTVRSCEHYTHNKIRLFLVHFYIRSFFSPITDSL